MTATAASSARPPKAAIAWVHAGSLYVEIPCKDGPPFVVRYPCTSTGLAQALNITIEHPAEAPNLTTAHPKVTSAKRTAAPSPYTTEQRSRAAALVRKLGIKENR